MNPAFFRKRLNWLQKQKFPNPDVTFKEFFDHPEKYPEGHKLLEETVLLMKMLKREVKQNE